MENKIQIDSSNMPELQKLNKVVKVNVVCIEGMLVLIESLSKRIEKLELR